MLYLHVDSFSTDSLSWKMVDLRDQSCLIHARHQLNLHSTI